MGLMVALKGALLVRLKAALRALVNHLLQVNIIDMILYKVLAVASIIAIRTFVSKILRMLSVDVTLKAIRVMC